MALDDYRVKIREAVGRAEVIQLTRDLQHFRSYPGQERECVEFLAAWLKNHGLEVQLIDVEPGRPVCVARLRGVGNGNSLMLNGHLDINPVPMNYPGDPWRCYEAEGRLYGHGIYNMKAGVAALAEAAAAVQRAGVRLRGDLVVAGVVGEMQGGVGTYDLVHRGVITDYAIVAEPSQLQITTVHATVVQMLIHVLGRSTWIGLIGRVKSVNAVEKMADVVHALKRLRFNVEPRPDLPGLPRALVGGIIGGITREYLHWRTPEVPDFCTIPFEVRTLPSHTPEDVVATVRALLAQLKTQDPDLEYEIELPPATYREPWRGKKHLQPGIDIPHDAPVVQALRRSHVAVLGRGPDAIGVHDPGSYGWTDAGHLVQAGCQAVVYGPAKHDQRTYVELGELEACAQVLALASLELCGVVEA